MIVNPSGACRENSIRAEVVAVIHVQEKPAFRSEHVVNRTECEPPFFRRWNVTEHVPQAGDDVESLGDRVRTAALGCPRAAAPAVLLGSFKPSVGQIFCPNRPDLGVLHRFAGHFSAGLCQDDSFDPQDGRNAEGPGAVPCAYVQTRLAALWNPRDDFALDATQIELAPAAQIRVVRRQSAVSGNGVVKVLGFHRSILATPGMNRRLRSTVRTDNPPTRHGSNLFSAKLGAKLCLRYAVLEDPDRDCRWDRIPGPAGVLHLPDVAQRPAAGAGEVSGSGSAHQGPDFDQIKSFARPHLRTRRQ